VDNHFNKTSGVHLYRFTKKDTGNHEEIRKTSPINRRVLKHGSTR